MPCHAMHPMQDYFRKVFHMHGKLICNLYALISLHELLRDISLHTIPPISALYILVHLGTARIDGVD
jgi:hypothetical protein